MIFSDYPALPRTSFFWRDQIRERLEDRYGVVLYVGVILGGVFPFAATFAALYTSYDVTYLIFNDILTDPYQRGLTEILLQFFMRAFIIFSIALETARTGTFFGCCIMVGIDIFAKIQEMLRSRVKSFDYFHIIYTHQRVLLSPIQDWLNLIIYLCLSLIFWVTVSSCWVCAKCYGKVHWPLYYFAVLGALFLIFSLVLLLPQSVHAVEITKEVVKLHFQQVRENYSKKKSRGGLLQLKQARAIAPIRFWYGPFWVIGKKFVMEYFSLILLRSFDAILILDFH